jgi:menaquinone-dependent protoporphyrinogen oxidase
LKYSSVGVILDRRLFFSGGLITATAIIYATVHGSTEKAAKLLSKELDNAKIFDINKESFDLDEFDTVVIGSYVRMGLFDKTIRKFVIRYYPSLMKKNTALFMCSLMKENEEKYWRNNYPPQLLEKSKTAHFGCEFDRTKFHGFEKRVAKSVTKRNDEKGIYPEYKLNREAIALFGKELKENGLS